MCESDVESEKFRSREKRNAYRPFQIQVTKLRYQLNF